MTKLIIWTPEEASKNLNQRLMDAREGRKHLEKTWRVNEKTVYNTKGSPLTPDLNFSLESSLGLFESPDQGDGSVSINYAFKNLRYVHAQLAANPPSVIPRPTSNDADDRRKADAADRIIRYAMKKYKLQDCVDRASLNALLYGSGFLKTKWNSDKGELLEFNEETGEQVMEGDLDVTVPTLWNVYLDPDAETWHDVRYVFERVIVPWDEAMYRWPEKAKLLEKYRIKNNDNLVGATGYDDSALKSRKFDVVELYEYWEKGLPSNGMLGRFVLCTRDGNLISPLGPNPERFLSKKRKNSEFRYECAELPYHLMTDIDVPSQIWGKSFVEYEATLQDMMNRLDSVTLEAVQAHGIPRLILPDGVELATDSITNSPWDIIKTTGVRDPKFMEPMPMPAIVTDLMARYKQGIDDMAGVNEAMFGQQSREQSGFSMQYATNQGNMIRFRLLNKYRGFVEDIYKSILQIIQKHWELPRTIEVVGKEKAFESVDIKGADIEGGYDLLADYGASLSLDPTSRREEMLTLMPLFEKAGVESRQILKMLKLNELGGAYDILELAADRQREIFEEMIATNTYIAPEELQDHKNMLSYAYMYLMTSEFKYLSPESKLLIKQHTKDREMLAAQGVQAPGTLEGTPGPVPQGMAPGATPPPLAGPDQLQAPALPPPGSPVT